MFFVCSYFKCKYIKIDAVIWKRWDTNKDLPSLTSHALFIPIDSQNELPYNLNKKSTMTDSR